MKAYVQSTGKCTGLKRHSRTNNNVKSWPLVSLKKKKRWKQLLTLEKALMIMHFSEENSATVAFWGKG